MATTTFEASDPLDDIEAAADALAKQYLPGVDRHQLGTQCLRLQTVSERINGILAANIAEAERAGVPATAKQRTMAQFLASRSHCAPEVVRAHARVGLWVGQFTQFEQAMLDGTLSRRHLDLLRKTENIRVFAAMQRDQAMFIEFVQDLEWTDYKNAVKYWLLVNDQDGPEPDDHEAQNTCSITTEADGRIKFSANLDPTTGAILKEHIELEANKLWDQDNEDNTIRTPTQRRAKALGNLVERGAGRSETSAQPLVHVVMSLQVMQRAMAQLAKPPEDQDFTSWLDANDVDGRCEFIDGSPLHPKAALILLMNARIRRQVLTAKSKTLDASEEVRLFPKWMKYIRLIETRGQCETAGCDAAVTWLQGDHKRPFSETQQTSLDNLAMLCAPDNKAKGNRAPLAERKPASDHTKTRPI